MSFSGVTYSKSDPEIRLKFDNQVKSRSGNEISSLFVLPEELVSKLFPIWLITP